MDGRLGNDGMIRMTGQDGHRNGNSGILGIGSVGHGQGIFFSFTPLHQSFFWL